MTIVLVAFINISFLLLIYIVFSRRLRQLEERKLPESIAQEIDSVLTTFNHAADRNIDLLDDRIAKLQPIVAQAEKKIELLEGVLRRAEALQKQKSLLLDSSKVNTRKELAEAVVVPTKSDSSVAPAHSSNAYQRNAIEKKEEKEKPTKKIAPRKRKRKSKEEKLLDLLSSDLPPETIAAQLGMTSEEVRLKQRMLAKS